MPRFLRFLLIAIGLIVISLFSFPSSTSLARSIADAGVRTAGGDSLIDAWVEFTDKGVDNERERRTILSELEANFNPRALERRRLRRTLPGLFDERDFPLVEEYIEGLSAMGAEVRVRSRWLNGVSVRASGPQIERIRDLPFVKDVLNQHEYTAPEPLSIKVITRHRSGERPDDATDFYGRAEVQVTQFGLDRLHEAGYTGRDVLVAVIDTGFDLSHEAFTHPDHPLRVAAQWDFMENDGDASIEEGDPAIQHEHGSLVLGTIAAYAPGELIGTAYDASFILCKAEDDATEYFLEERWFVAALEYAESLGADVATSSVLLYDEYEWEDADGGTSVMTRGWNLATGNGVIGLQGAGNFGHDSDPGTSTTIPPADAIDVISCGAVNRGGMIVEFSSDGPTFDGRRKPELLAMGAFPWTTSPFDRDGYTQSAGTSISTPILAGAVACLLQARPGWTVSEIREALFHSGDYYRSYGAPDSLYVHGYGIPDVYLAAGIDTTSR